VGISAGDGQTYQQLAGYDGQATLTNAPSVELDLRPGTADIGAYEFRGSSLDVTPPTVAGTFPPVVQAGGSTGGALNTIQLNFSEDVNPNDAISTAVYELRQAGSGGFGSVDDVVYPLTPRYVPGPRRRTSTSTGSTALGFRPGRIGSLSAATPTAPSTTWPACAWTVTATATRAGTTCAPSPWCPPRPTSP
jgi:hypothetical protein